MIFYQSVVASDAQNQATKLSGDTSFQNKIKTHFFGGPKFLSRYHSVCQWHLKVFRK